jgi:hypothetical protein
VYDGLTNTDSETRDEIDFLRSSKTDFAPGAFGNSIWVTQFIAETPHNPALFYMFDVFLAGNDNETRYLSLKIVQGTYPENLATRKVGKIMLVQDPIQDTKIAIVYISE